MSDERSFIALSIAILTVSDTRSLDEDRSGSLLVERLTESGHKVADRQIVTDDVPRYTRDGRFRLDELGRITNQAGQPVAGDGGGEIVINPEDGKVTIAADGAISQGENLLGRVAVVRFDDLSVLEKTGDNLLRNTSNLQPAPAPDVRVRQGMLESSNVKPILEITRMIEVTRAYESITRMMESSADLSRRAVERMGRAN